VDLRLRDSHRPLRVETHEHPKSYIASFSETFFSVLVLFDALRTGGGMLGGSDALASPRARDPLGAVPR
jgi:hypothetical protein